MIKENIEFLRARIEDYQGRIRALQDKCLHEDFHGHYKASTGNWCPQDDSYWINFTCNICGATEMVDSDDDPERYRELSLSGKITNGIGQSQKR
ncbi:hypothetical protein D3C85_374530 [compost metagenome]